MVNCSINIPKTKNILQQIEKILVSKGITRKAIIKGDTLQAFGEVGLRTFSISKKSENTVTLEARNQEALDIISNLLEVELSELEETITEQVFSCMKCNIPLEYLGEKEVLPEIKVAIFCCPECKRVEIFKN